MKFKKLPGKNGAQRDTSCKRPRPIIRIIIFLLHPLLYLLYIHPNSFIFNIKAVCLFLFILIRHETKQGVYFNVFFFSLLVFKLFFLSRWMACKDATQCVRRTFPACVRVGL